MDEVPPDTIFLIKATGVNRKKEVVTFNETFNFNSLNPNFRTNNEGTLFYKDILVIKKQELRKIHQNNSKEIQTYTQSLKICKACNIYYYNNNSHRDEKHIVNSLYQYDLNHQKKNQTEEIKLEVLHPQTNLTEYVLYQEKKLFIYSEGKLPREVQMKVKNCSNKTISLDKAIADNSRNGYITWSGGILQANLQIYQFNEEIAPDATSTQIIQIHLPGEIEASKDMTIKFKTLEGTILDIDVIVFNNYLEHNTESKLEERISKQWRYEKDKENLREDLNNKLSYVPSKDLFESLSVYADLQNRFKTYKGKTPSSILSNLPTDIRRVVQVLSEETTRDNFREKFTHYTKAELTHYLSEMASTKTTVITSSFVGLKTKITLELDLQSLQQLNLGMNDTILLKTNLEILECRIVLSEIHQTTVEANVIKDITPKTSIQVTSPIRITPFKNVMTAIEATGDMATGLATKNYLFPTSIRTKPSDNKAEIDDATLDECQREAVHKINNLARGDVFTLQGPPGTGKSRTIVEVINQACKKGERTLLVCQTNSAVNDMFSRLKTSLKHKKIIKILAPTAKVEKVCETHCAGNLRDGDMRHAFPSPEDVYNAEIVVITTVNCHRLNNLKGFNEATSKGFNKTFHNVVIDEAAYSSEPNLLIPIVRNIIGGEQIFRLILIGDPLQLHQYPRSAIFRDIKSSDIMTRVNKFLFKYSTNHHMLRNNYRNSQIICRLLNRLCYDNKLVCMNQEKGKITLIHAETSKTSMNTQSKFSIPEAATTIRFVKQRGKADENYKILSYYAAHRVKILEEAQTQQCRNISVSTVEGVQGLEGKNIVLNTTLPSLTNRWQLNKNRLNVIISRTQQNLTIVGNLGDMISHQLYKEIILEAVLSPTSEILAPQNIRNLIHRDSFDKKAKKQRKVIQDSFHSM